MTRVNGALIGRQRLAESPGRARSCRAAFGGDERKPGSESDWPVFGGSAGLNGYLYLT